MAENNTLCTVERLRHVIASVTPPREFLTPEMRSLGPALQRGKNEKEFKKFLHELYSKPDNQKPGADEVYPGIFVGDSVSAQDLEFLKSHGIKAVLNTAQGTKTGQLDTTEEFYRDAGIKFQGLSISDNIQTNIISCMDPCIKFIDEALNGSGKILIHCFIGMSRSIVIAASYLMIRKHMSAEEALRTIKQKRDMAPNEGFLAQLCELDAKLKNSK